MVVLGFPEPNFFSICPFKLNYGTLMLRNHDSLQALGGSGLIKPDTNIGGKITAISEVFIEKTALIGQV